MARRPERFSRIFMFAFVSFFFTPALVVAVLVIFAPDRVSYGNSGLVLLLSVVGGAMFGALVGSIEYPRATRADPGEVSWVDDLWDADLDA